VELESSFDLMTT